MTPGRFTDWLNNLNSVTWKTVLVGMLQTAFVFVVLYVWAAASLHSVYSVAPGGHINLQRDILDGLELFLAGLSGFTLGGRFVQRTTDYKYQQIKNEGKAAVANAQQPPPQVITTGDNTQVTATQPPNASPPPAQVAPTSPANARKIAAETDDDPGLG